MSAGTIVIVFLVAFCTIVWLWIKGTDPQSSDFWYYLWLVLRIPLFICGGFLLICFAGAATSKR